MQLTHRYPEAANNYTFMQGQRRWKRMRRSRQPNGGRIPEDIHELAEALTRLENAVYSQTLQTPPSNFFQQELLVNESSEGIIFANLDATRRFREELATVTTVGIDGTFKTVPATPANLRSFLTFQVVGPEFISVFGEDYRTNNYLESFHSSLLSQMGRHPNIWDFLRKLTYIENQFSVEFNQVRNNLRVRDGISRSERVIATYIIAQNVQRLNEQQDLLLFLRNTGHRNDGYVQREIGPYAQP
ncbi:Uncharacterized protein FWK35_00028820 [Aphis craccivora]|uniref:Uncharacterized protein n=1 Tax=Aphis craccivora TaxID=307492 RepID=A0A6G0WRE7_APHCR|nr:Uncharacterized protein FWK35_00028820 [Aphis craccivora]